MASADVIHVTPANWQSEVLDSTVPVLVDFWAEWCGPCKMIGPIIDELAAEMKDKVKFAKVDVDANQQLASDFGIRSIPTLLIVKDGVVQQQMVGAMSKLALRDKLTSYA